ncbi:hypothetical protein PHMEG_00023286, partial [Phytophthora megakarya]
GLDKRLKVKNATRPASIPRGTFTFSRSVAIPTMLMFHWWDRKPVHYLCTGAVMTPSSIERKVKQIGPITVPCPAAVNNYQNWMGGVDVHDQLRLQAYSLQTSTKFKKYYKRLFLGFIDLVLVNAYISHTEALKIAGTPSMKRREWYGILQNQLLQLKAEDFTGVVATPPATTAKRKRTPRMTHVLEQNEDWVTVANVQKRRQRSCKVCALLRTDRKKKSYATNRQRSCKVCALLRTDRKKKSYATTFFCERCSIDDAKCWLCNKIRREYKGVAKTCFEIWHDDFDAGQTIPANLGKRVVLRRPGQEAGKRKKTRRELQLRGDEADDEAE